MTDMLSLGLSGLRATARALSTVSDNIANAQTPGFARRSVRIDEGAPGGDNPLYKSQHTPGGAVYGGITRHVDELLVEDARVAISANGHSAARLGWLEAVERDLDDGPAGVGASITRVFNAADQLVANPTSLALRATFLQNVDDVASAFRRVSIGLEATAAGISKDAAAQVEALNTELNALQSVNEGLLRARPQSTNQASLLDERDKLLDQLSERVAVTTRFDAHGIVTVSLAGPGGHSLLDGPNVAGIVVATGLDGQVSFGLQSGTGVAPQSGTLAGLVQASGQVAATRARLDTLAGQFGGDLNGAHQAGYDMHGNAGMLLLAGGSAKSIAGLPLSAERVAVADAASVNGNFLTLEDLRGAGGVEAGWAGLVDGHASATASVRTLDAAAAGRRDGAWEARDAVSSVDLDREAAELLRYQQAYEASARVIQVARETIQAIMNAF